MAYLVLLKLRHFQITLQTQATAFTCLRGLVRCNWSVKVVEDLKSTDEDEKVPRSFYVHSSPEPQKYVIRIKTDGSMVYNRQQLKMKKKKLIVILVSALALVALSSFTIRGWYTCKTCNGKGYSYTKSCSRCSGQGTIMNIVDCPRCDGKGYIRDSYGDQQTCPRCNGSKKENRTTTCPKCNGSGEEKVPCRACNGKGQVWVDD